jgi:hypothetical protein
VDDVVSIPRVDLVLHSQGGWAQPIGQEDAAGVAVDISGQDIRIRTESGLDVAAVADPANPAGLLLQLTEAQVGAIQDLDGHSTQYAIVNVTANPDEVMCFGRLMVEGW